jgi:hypothetical protein
MDFGKVKQIGLFRKTAMRTPNEHLLTVKELETAFFLPDGTNTYVGLSELVERVDNGGDALHANHKTPLKQLAQFATQANPKFLAINLEPNSSPKGKAQLQFVLDNLDPLEQFAEELAEVDEVQSGAIIPVVRFGGEMNSGNTHSGFPKIYKECFEKVAPLFQGKGIATSFCPAINSGIKGVQDILDYMPDDLDLIDYISCTLYIRPESNFEEVMDTFHLYVKTFPGKKVLIDELSGCMTQTTGNDKMVRKMLAAIEVKVEYATLFLSEGPAIPPSPGQEARAEVPWGKDVTLAFLDSPAPVG